MIFRTAAARLGIQRLVAQQVRQASTKSVAQSGGGSFVPNALLRNWYNTYVGIFMVSLHAAVVQVPRLVGRIIT